MRAGIFLTVLGVSGCSYLQQASKAPAPAPAPAAAKTTSATATRFTSAASLVKAMHDRYAGKYLKTMNFVQNNIAYTTTGQEQKSQWYRHVEIPGKLRIAFLPATQKSGLVEVDDRVASFDNGLRVDFRPSVNPLLLLTADVFVTPVAMTLRGLDSLHVDTDMIRSGEWQGNPVYIVGAKAGDSTSNQMWVDKEHLRLVRFIQRSEAGDRTIVSDIRVQGYKGVQGFDVPTEFLTLRNGRPVWREQYGDIRVNEQFLPGTFDQAKWYDIPIPNPTK